MGRLLVVACMAAAVAALVAGAANQGFATAERLAAQAGADRRLIPESII